MILVAGTGGFLAYRAQSQESAVVFVNGQGSPPELWARAQTVQAQMQQRYPKYFAQIDINTLIEQILINQEAARRGIACTEQDAKDFIAQQIAIASSSPDGAGSLLAVADLYGAVPPGYVTMPEAQRTPSTDDAVATWAALPDVVQGVRRLLHQSAPLQRRDAAQRNQRAAERRDRCAARAPARRRPYHVERLRAGEHAVATRQHDDAVA